MRHPKTPPPVGLEPTTFELEVQHASPLRHGGCIQRCLNLRVFVVLRFCLFVCLFVCLFIAVVVNYVSF